MDLNLAIQNPDEKGKGYLAGKATVTSASGTLPPFDLFNFKVIGDSFADLTNYSRDRSGKWKAITRYPGPALPSVKISRSATNLTLEFQVFERRLPAGVYTIALRLADSKMNSHTLAQSVEATIQGP